MANGMNKFLGAGNLCADPEAKKVGDQDLTSIRLAMNETWKGKDGEKQEKTEYLTVNFWGAKAPPVAKFFKKGSFIIIEGKIQTRQWEDKDGNKRYTTECRGDNFWFGPKVNGGDGSSSGNHDDSGGYSPPENPDDNIPF